eukprot:326736_1
MTTFSQLIQYLKQYPRVKQNIKIVQLNSLPHLNKNEIADKTAHIKNYGYHQSITQKCTLQRHLNKMNPFETENINEEINTCLNIIIWNNNRIDSNQSVDPPPGQPISLDLIIIIGFAVDPPPDQLTPTYIIIISCLVNNNQALKKTQHSSVVTINNTNQTTIIIHIPNNGYNTNLNNNSPYAAAVGLSLHPITNKGASSTLGDQYKIEKPLNYHIKLNQIISEIL